MLLFRKPSPELRFKLALGTTFFLAHAILVSCGSSSSKENPDATEGTLGSTPFLILSESGLTFSESMLKGSGSAIAKNPLGEIKDDKNISLTFALEDGGSASLKAFGGKTNSGGVSFTFSRKEKVLSAQLEASGKSVDVSKNFSAFDASTDVSLQIDIHNNETPAHILVWKGDTKEPNDTNALFNSEKAGDGESPGNGTGTFWGLVLSKAIVKSAAVGKAKFEHE